MSAALNIRRAKIRRKTRERERMLLDIQHRNNVHQLQIHWEEQRLARTKTLNLSNWFGVK